MRLTWQRLWLLVCSLALGASAAAALSVPVAGAAGGSVVVEADDFGLWEGDRRVFVASGNVRLVHGEVTIRADSLMYDMNAEEITLHGGVVYRDPDAEMSGTSLRYDVAGQRGWLDDVEAVYRQDEWGDPVFLFGKSIYRDPDRIVVTGARVTTCTVDQPPYHLAAREVEVFPGERLVVRDVRFVEHGITLAYWPYLAISLKEERSRFDAPRPGYNQRDGWYVLWTYNYETGGDDYGSLYVDYYQRRGLGTGVRHVYQHSARQYGELYLYTVGNPDGGRDYKGEVQHRWLLSTGLEARGTARYESLGFGGPNPEEIIRGEGSLYRGTAGRVFDVQGRFLEERRRTGGKLELDASGRVVYQFPNDWHFSLRGSAYRMNTETRDARRYSYLAQVEKRWSDYTLLIDVEQRIHPTLEKYRHRDPETEWFSMHRLPEVTLSTNRTLLGLPFTFRVTGGHFREFSRDDQARQDWRLAALAQMRGVTYPLSRTASLTLRAGATSYTYGRHENQLALTGRATLAYRPFRSLRLTADYDHQRSWGSTPFHFDRLVPQDTVTPRVQWNRGPWNVLLTTRYNLQTHQWDRSLVSQAVYRHGIVDGRLTTTYDMQRKRWGQAIATIALTPSEGRRLRVGATYNMEQNRLTRLDVEGAIPLFAGWRLGASMIYDIWNNKFSTGFFKLTKDLGCREISISYDHLDREVWLEYHIFAFPQSRVRVGRREDDARFLFEQDWLRELLEEE